MSVSMSLCLNGFIHECRDCTHPVSDSFNVDDSSPSYPSRQCASSTQLKLGLSSSLIATAIKIRYSRLRVGILPAKRTDLYRRNKTQQLSAQRETAAKHQSISALSTNHSVSHSILLIAPTQSQQTSTTGQSLMQPTSNDQQPLRSSSEPQPQQQQQQSQHQQGPPPPHQPPQASPNDNTEQPTQPVRKISYWPPPEAFYVGNCDSPTCTHGGKAITLADKRYRHGCGAIFHLGCAQRYEGRDNPACPSCRESINDVRSE